MTVLRRPPKQFSSFYLALSAICMLLDSGMLRAQAPQTGSPTFGTSSSAPGLSIESEMLTYRALESNSDAIACEVASLLSGRPLDDSAWISLAKSVGRRCAISVPEAGQLVVILPFDSTVVSEFATWRSDMQTMSEMLERARGPCLVAGSPEPSPWTYTATSPGNLSVIGGTVSSVTLKHGSNSSGTGQTSGLFPMEAGDSAIITYSDAPTVRFIPLSAAQESNKAPVQGGGPTRGSGNGGLFAPLQGPELSVASSVLGLFASSYSVTPVGGTIGDQAFINNVGRDLRILNVPILSPSLYTPDTLSPIDVFSSPFVARLMPLLWVHDCLYNSNGKDDPGVTDIEKFLTVLSGSGAVVSPSESGSDQANASQGNNNVGEKANSQVGGNAASSARAYSHLDAVLNADALARRLGISLAGQEINAAKVHILLLKALESGGEVSRFTNIFGTRIYYSGGSVGTYALFSLDGQIECEGNVYDYAGAVPFKNFDKKLRDYAPDPSSQVIFHRGQCPALSLGK